ncbi:MAG: efflux RND transporter periplasmic adaptor subunit [Pseudomonadota bacterium]
MKYRLRVFSRQNKGCAEGAECEKRTLARYLSAGLALCTTLCLLACDNTVPSAAPASTVLTQRVRAADAALAEQNMRYAGEVRARHEIPLSFRLAGKIAERHVDLGSVVKSGQLLARLDAQDSQLTLSAAQAEWQLAQTELARYQTLRTQNFVSQAALDLKQAALTSAQARRQLAQNQAGYSELRAEHSGVIAQVHAEPGQVVSAGQAVFLLARPDQLEVAIALPEQALAAVHLGQRAEIRLWANAQARYEGVLRELSPLADPRTRTYAARVTIEQADARIALGMSAQVLFLPDAQKPSETPGTASLDAPLSVPSSAPIGVPLSALFQKEGQPALWVVNADQTLALRPVSVRSYGNTQAILDAPRHTQAGAKQGVSQGERIVIAGVHQLTQGAKIIPREQASP